MKAVIPKEIVNVVETLENKGFQAYLVGGCARDLLMGRKPKDWDVTTNARPEEIVACFPKTFYENDFGTVGVVNEGVEDKSLEIIEVTPYRIETGYSDFRHPDQVKFSKSLDDDLKRRDFTINAIAINLSDGAIKDITDNFGGFKDIKDKIIRTVGNPNDRFNEDGLRMMRAVRIGVELDFKIDPETSRAIGENPHILKNISAERVRDEFTRIIMSDSPKKGVEDLHSHGLLRYIAPELEKGIGVEQNKAHAYDVWEHLLRSLQHAADKKYDLETRLAALFHDIAKPETKRFSHETQQYTFYNHEMVGSRVTSRILERLRFSRKTSEKVVKLVRWHMFFADTEEITLSAVRRMISNVGKENIWDLMNVRICDRIGTGRPKENPYRLRKYKAMVEEALMDPISVGMLKIDGKGVMDVTHVTPGPKVGYILHALLEEIFDDPRLNNQEYLEKRAKELANIDEKELKKLGEVGKITREKKEEESIKEIRGKYHVS